ncbi:unnamed protein product [Paramecium octaurelia]|uniref:Uncharacterized protein n=1 Tax=Paramecium octaurelia TaxID=43137 RepID=A0A8S1V2S4_PAROT|nr:unnamed protein product [Paramecium octaurelia]
MSLIFYQGNLIQDCGKMNGSNLVDIQVDQNVLSWTFEQQSKTTLNSYQSLIKIYNQPIQLLKLKFHWVLQF